MRTLMKSFDGWEFTFVDAPNRSSNEAKIDEAVLLAFPKQVQQHGVYEWYNANTDKDTGVVEYANLSKSLDYVRDLLVNSPKPFDVLLGFSQGGTFAWMVNAMIEGGEIKLPAHHRPKLVVMLNSMGPRSQQFLQMEPTTTCTPTVQVFGKKDRVIPRDSWARWDAGFMPSVETEEIHAVPRTTQSCKVVSDLVLRSAHRKWYAFDFDGVICDSATETGKTGLVCLKLLFPELQIGDESKLVQDFCTARPLLETGYEAIVILYRLTVGGELAKDMVESKTPLEDMERALVSMPFPKQRLVDLFKQQRDLWISTDEIGWLNENSFYAPTMEAIKSLWTDKRASVYVVTTKHRTFARKLLERAGLQDFPEDRLFGLGTGKKREVLHMLASTREAKLGGTCVFVEDRVETLRDVALNGTLPVELMLAGYGYNTAEDRRSAQEHGFTVCETSQALATMLIK